MGPAFVASERRGANAAPTRITHQSQSLHYGRRGMRPTEIKISTTGDAVSSDRVLSSAWFSLRGGEAHEEHKCCIRHCAKAWHLKQPNQGVRGRPRT
jgi:hypothetical protein